MKAAMLQLSSFLTIKPPPPTTTTQAVNNESQLYHQCPLLLHQRMVNYLNVIKKNTNINGSTTDRLITSSLINRNNNNNNTLLSSRRDDSLFECKCRRKDVQLINDLEFDYFLSFAPPKQLICILVVDRK
jgi:hypothetical protein